MNIKKRRRDTYNNQALSEFVFEGENKLSLDTYPNLVQIEGQLWLTEKGEEIESYKTRQNLTT